MIDDPYTLERRLCDDRGWVSRVFTDPPNAFDSTLTYLQQLNNLRAHTGLEPVYEEFMCTGSAHLANEHIRCTSPVHAAQAAVKIKNGDVGEAIKIVDESRATHVKWRDWLVAAQAHKEKHGTDEFVCGEADCTQDHNYDVLIAGDLAHHLERIEAYDKVLNVLRTLT